MGPEIALAASARDWPNRVHRFLLDHGGGRVRVRVMGAEQALGGEFDVLFIDDVCSFLTTRLVRRLREQGREVVGVFSPTDGPDAKRRLLECGISDVVEADAPPEEFLQLASTTMAHRIPLVPEPQVRGASGFRIGVCSAATGAGCTEMALALAGHVARLTDVVLLDLDQAHPGVAQRLDLSLHPNLRTAVDLAHHDPGRLGDAVHRLGNLAVVGGLAASVLNSPLAGSEISALLEDLASIYPLLVLDMGEATNSSGIECQVLLVVAEASPVGMTRLIRVMEGGLADDVDDVLLVVNRLAGGGRRRDDIRAELAAALPGVSCMFLPEDPRIGRAAWDGALELGGPFGRATGRVARLIVEGAPV